jgi:hypothetical protein
MFDKAVAMTAVTPTSRTTMSNVATRALLVAIVSLEDG